ncbi:MAG TPA: 3-hydroxyacyl-CoA dehydrogenase NAD-binding domain-containing protein [Bryobacteraceae bacterium]|nr:3-hydroxyacyl-CoA dehydrogenase NAD-binding domain-containing protein [Bryobacteraceae bacterium]
MSQPIAVLSGPTWEEFSAQAASAIADNEVRGAIVRVGGGLGESGYPSDPTTLAAVLRKVESGGKPAVAVIDGPVSAAALEVCLACHHRIAADGPRTRIALWDILSGTMPGLGATQRLPRLAGVSRALTLLLDGQTLTAQQARDAGLVDALAPPEGVLDQARAWILSLEGKAPSQPWDAANFRIPGGAVGQFGPASAKLWERTLGLYPAPLAILSSVFEGCQVDFDNGLKIEARYYAGVRETPEARNLARLRQFRAELDRLSARPAGVPTVEFSKIGILGAGMMGSGIASVCAGAGLDVVLLDVTPDRAERGKAASVAVFDRQVARAQLSPASRDAAASRIHATAEFAGLRGCDVVIEAVFEDRAVKADVTQQTEAVTGSGIVFASNTSTLPITGLAAAWSRPGNFIGMHFFSPVDRMPLLEIIRGKQTSDECLAIALDLARKLRKTPIVVNDSRGFYTSRVFSTYLNEGMSMLLEGVAPALIENSGRMAGMPVGPLVLADEVSLDLLRSVRQQTRADLGDRYRPGATDRVLEVMIDQCGRHGRKARQGFYDYPDSGPKRLWPDLAKWYPGRAGQPTADELIRRFRWIQSLETLRCLEEGVLRDRRDADIGSVLGWGFCPALGGTIGHIQTVGTARFTEESIRLAGLHGERFTAPKLLQEMVFA